MADDLVEELKLYVEKLGEKEKSAYRKARSGSNRDDRAKQGGIQDTYIEVIRELRNLIQEADKPVALRKLFEDIPEAVVTVDEAIHIDMGDREEIVSLYPVQKKAVFHDEYVQTVLDIPKLKPLLDYLEREGYSTNLS